MIAFLIVLVTGIIGAVFLKRFKNALKEKSKRRFLAGFVSALFLTVCALQISFIFWEPKLGIKLDEGALKTFAVELETPEQYEQWFQPEMDFEYYDTNRSSWALETHAMGKYLLRKKPDAYNNVFVNFKYFETEEQAKATFDEESRSYRFVSGKTKQINPEHEYICSKTTFVIAAPCAVFFAFLPEGRFSSDVMIRHKNAIYTFGEYSGTRRSQIDKVIEELWADYLEYKGDL